MKILCPISLGELIDKISILRIKQQKISDPENLALATQESDLLTEILAKLNLKDADKYLTELIFINTELWEIEDKIRLKEKDILFDEEFIKLARSVYMINDQRFELKNKINNTFKSSLREVKSYSDYN